VPRVRLRFPRLWLALAAALPLPSTAVAVGPGPAPAKPAAIEDSVVHIFATLRHPDPFRPWTKLPPQEISGSGVVIEGRRILTNAHVVLYASQVQVQANESGDKIPATVVAVAPGIDLAVLKLEDESFFDAHPPLPRASVLPAIKDSVLVYGFPTGGTSLSITKGIVSRIEFANYNYPVAGLRIQIDAAINPGNSGGPAVVGNQLIGLAFSHLRDAQAIGYIIPTEEIELFLRGVAQGRYDGKPALHDAFQAMENPALRAYLRVGASVRGVVVVRVDDPRSPLKPGDVIVAIADQPIDDQGMVQAGGLRLRFQYFVQRFARDGRVALTVTRGGRTTVLGVPAPTHRDLLIPDLNGAYPPYFICGPIAFTVASAQLLAPIANNGPTLSAMAADASPLVLRRGDQPAFAGEQLVVIAAPFFPHRLTKGYLGAQLRVVERVNELPIRNLRELVEVVRDARGPFLKIDFAGRSHETIILPRAETLAATEDILNDNGVRALGSPEVMAVWGAK
jgi:S1-C subfamily serine protease